MTPSALHSLRQAGTSTRQTLRAATITLGSVDYACAAMVGSIKPEMDEETMTNRQVQRATVEILRSALPVCPTASVRVKFRGLEWLVDSLGEQGDTAIVWKIGLKRVITKAAT